MGDITKSQISTKNLVLSALFTALISISAFIIIPMVPVSITGQSFFVLTAGYFLGSKYGALSCALYMLLGLIGLPIFSGGRGGYQAIFMPSFGFIIGFIIAAALVGYLSRKYKPVEFKNIFLIFLIGTLTISLFGLIYMAGYFYITARDTFNLFNIIKSGFLLFLPGDIFKVFLATLLAKRAGFLIKNN